MTFFHDDFFNNGAILFLKYTSDDVYFVVDGFLETFELLIGVLFFSHIKITVIIITFL